MKIQQLINTAFTYAIKRFEMMLLANYFSPRRKRYREMDDAWMLAKDGEVSGPVYFREAMKYAVEGGAPFDLLHGSETENEEPRWMHVEYSPFWIRSEIVRRVKMGVWIALAVVLFLIVDAYLPWQYRGTSELSCLGLVAVMFVMTFYRPRIRLGPSSWELLRTWSVRLTILSAVVAGTLFAIFDPSGQQMVSACRDRITSLSARNFSQKAKAWTSEMVRSEPTKSLATPAPVAATNQALPVPSKRKEFAPPVVDGSAVGLVETKLPVRAALAMPAIALPQIMACKVPVTFPLSKDGRVIGSMKLPAGTQVRAVAMQGQQVLVEYQNNRAYVASASLAAVPMQVSHALPPAR